MEFSGRGILLDIEGTTSSIRFVYEVMFPFVRRDLEGFLSAQWDSPAVQQACERIAQDAGHASLDAWCGTDSAQEQRRRIQEEVLRLMDADVKATGLKQLQGLIWRSGFEGGELRAHVYDDVPPALERWRRAGLDLRIYSSGSIAAQKLFFGHTEAGDLLSFFQGHYDTTTGAKKEAASYRAIAEDFGLPPRQILFLSDVVAELDAAATAGLRTALCIRPGNEEVPPGHGHPTVTTFEALAVSPR